jgi:DNA-binding transcriptional MerR regulator
MTGPLRLTQLGVHQQTPQLRQVGIAQRAGRSGRAGSDEQTPWPGQVGVDQRGQGSGRGGSEQQTLRSGEVAAAAGVNQQTLRYYERRGLVAEPARTLGGHRQYPAETVQLLRTIKSAQRLGFTLDEIADLVAVGRRHAGPHRLAVTKLAEVEQRIADLAEIRDMLREAVAAGCDDLTSCAATPRCPLPYAGS